MTLSIAPTTLSFGGHIVWNKATLTVIVTGNDEPFTLRVAGQAPPGVFTVPNPHGVATSAGVAVAVVFFPDQVGDVSATLHVSPTGSNVDTDYVALTGSGIVAQNVETISGSHLLIEVPDYGDTTYVNNTEAVTDGIDPTALDGNTLHSYLRMGAFDYARESAAAKELLKIIPKGGPAKDPRSPNPGTVIIPASTSCGTDAVSGLVFNDDVRVRPQDRAARDTTDGATRISSLTKDDDPDHGLTADERRNESARLYARGGWRDHSDGNRISTTWGDKVEVVRGNYKMIVLGRQNDPTKAMGWEASGGHIQDYAPGTMPGASFWLEWIDDTRFYATGDGGDGRKGAWLLVNTTENVYQFARTAGTLRDEKWGDVHESYIGSENPPDASAVDTFAEAIDPNAATREGGAFAVDTEHGTGGHSVDDSIKIAGRNYLTTTPPDAHDQKGKIRSNPHIISKTWAERIDESKGTSACRIPIVKSETWVRDADELVDVSGVKTSNTRAATIASATTAGNIWEATTAALHGEMHVGGLHLGIELGGHVELEVGGHLSIEIAMKGEIQIAGGFEIGIGELKEIRFGKKKVAFDDAQIALKDSKLALSSARSTLRSQYTSLEEKHTAMMAAITALSVNIGV